MDGNGNVWIAVAAIGSLLGGIAAIVALTKDNGEPPRAYEPQIAGNRADPESAATPVVNQVFEPSRARAEPPTRETPLQDTDAAYVPLHSAANQLPSKVDIFWCDDGSSGAAGRRSVALAVRSSLEDSGVIRSVRARPLGSDVNRTPSYSIYDNIVRYDPGEADAAKALAQASEKATGASFSAAPALPGSPSVDYLSIFVCR